MPRASLQRMIDRLPFFDTHSHMAGMDTGSPPDDRREVTLAGVLTHDYLAYLAGSCSEVAVQAQTLGARANEPDRGAAALQPLLDACRGMATWAALREGIRALHGFHGADITLRNWAGIDRRLSAAYRAHGERAWQREVLSRAGVVRQVHICQYPYVAEHWAGLPAAERAAQAAVLLPSLVIDGYCFTGLAQNNAMRERSLALLGLNALPPALPDYLSFCGRVLDRFVAGGGRSVKLLAAYVRPLRFEAVPTEEAAALYARGPARLTPAELKRLQDHLLWELLALAKARHLPLLVHTGYSIPTAWGDPEHLLDLVASPRLAGLKIALVHAGWPRGEGAMIMARTWRHCYFDMAWIPLLSPAAAERILSEALDIVPMNKILLGTDTGTAESFFGTVQIVRRTVARVLAAKVQAGCYGEDTAIAMAHRLFYGNACEFFNEPTERLRIPGAGSGTDGESPRRSTPRRRTRSGRRRSPRRGRR